MTDVALFAAVFLACIVEAVEATTIVVAMGATRHWGSALIGSIAAIVVLAAAVAIFGPTILLLPLAVLRVVVGGLLLVFGLQWLRKAVLRASGVKSLHDEDAIFRKQVAAAEAAQADRRFGVSDWYAFTVSFKGVLLEGLEVVFIVLTFATNEGNLPVAVVAALAAIVVVIVAGAIVRGPLSRVPENTLKFVVGIMLASFGTFWGAEGAGALWPGSDAALLVIAPAVAVYCLLLVLVFTRRRRAAATLARVPVAAAAGGSSSVTEEPRREQPAVEQPAAEVPTKKPGALARFGLFWYDFIVGDDWLVTLGVVVMLALVAVAHVWTGAWVIAGVFVLALIPFGTARAARG
ncbi:COG4280 domain-containing protein [Gryllotalpicola reticulitermitis]|uniref:COG4280 domain-containing protein n=1 Tax=Gryllotalpicola reticulitermitis TaxID=1184153 RepID=A0ABV8Q4Y1_9MICO